MRLAVPVAVGLLRRDLVLDLVVLDDAALLDVDEEASCPAAGGPSPRSASAGYSSTPVSRREHDEVVVRDLPAAGAQAVAVERRADDAAVGERHRGGAVPRLHQARVVRVEVAAGGRGMSSRPSHASGIIIISACGQRAAGEHEQLEHVVEDRASPSRTRRRPGDSCCRSSPEGLAEQARLARAHPVDVAAERVDLAVVGDHPVRVRELPARERVRGEARVDERELALDALVDEVGEVLAQLRAREHALVDDGARAEARDRDVAAARLLDHAADHVELALERVLVVSSSRSRRRTPGGSTGSTAAALAPGTSWSTGTSRQPSSFWP